MRVARLDFLGHGLGVVRAFGTPFDSINGRAYTTETNGLCIARREGRLASLP